MKSFLLATGEKNPLAEINRQVPSPMLPLINRPTMMYSVELLYRHGIRDIFANLYNYGEQIEEYFGTGERWGVELKYLLQREALGSAGALRRAQYHIDGTFIVLPADSIIDFDIPEALALHRASGRVATVIVSEQPDFPIENEPIVTLGADDTLTPAYANSLDSTDSGSSVADMERRYCNTGAYIFEPQVLSYIPDDREFNCHTDLIEAIQKAGHSVKGYVTTGYWNPLDTYQAYQHAQSALLKRLNDGPPTALDVGVPYTYVHDLEFAPGIWYGKNTRIHPEARLYPPVHIGHGTQLLARSSVGPNVVIGSHAVVAKDASVKDSTILDNTYVEEGQNIQQRLVSKDVLVSTETGEDSLVANTGAVSDISPHLLSEQLVFVFEKLMTILLLVLAIPLLFIICFIQLATSGRPIFTIVSKMGCPPRKFGTEFVGSKNLSLIHFRTRTTGGGMTKTGSWLEKYELYRLPELWNVVKGDLALVGTEPLTGNEVSQLKEEWEEQRYRCKVGFTGLWYTEASTSSSLVERCAVDAYYGATHSSYVDFIQLMSTPIAWIRRIRQKQSAPVVGPNYSSNESANTVVLGSD